jgi:hypothetical protein
MCSGACAQMLVLIFYKEYILIARRYQLHPASGTTSCPNGIKDTHSQKKRRKELQKRKSRYRYPYPETATLTPPRQHQKITFFIGDASKKETVHKHCRRLIIDLKFSP